jgi:hypothetical protein
MFLNCGDWSGRPSPSPIDSSSSNKFRKGHFDDGSVDVGVLYVCTRVGFFCIFSKACRLEGIGTELPYEIFVVRALLTLLFCVTS